MNTFRRIAASPFLKVAHALHSIGFLIFFGKKTFKLIRENEKKAIEEMNAVIEMQIAKMAGIPIH